MEPGAAARDPRADLLALYDDALPQVYGYLIRRCRDRDVAEDLTSETFLAAVDLIRRNPSAAMSVAYLIGVARHKLADHWRRQAREERGLQAVGIDEAPDGDDGGWDAELDAIRAADVLARLGPVHRLVLTLRYVDDLPVADVARLLGRTLHATEALLVRARTAFRRVYTAGEEAGRG